VQFLSRIPSSLAPGLDTLLGIATRAGLVLLEIPMYWFVWPSAFSWYLALKEASVLVSDAVLEARKEVVSTAVLDEKWDESVVPKIQELAKKTMPWGSCPPVGSVPAVTANSVLYTNTVLSARCGGLSRQTLTSTFPSLQFLRHQSSASSAAAESDRGRHSPRPHPCS
jgi:hypothetical protein